VIDLDIVSAGLFMINLQNSPGRFPMSSRFSSSVLLLPRPQSATKWERVGVRANNQRHPVAFNRYRRSYYDDPYKHKRTGDETLPSKLPKINSPAIPDKNVRE
jgi:hypothetical protein